MKKPLEKQSPAIISRKSIQQYFKAFAATLLVLLLLGSASNHADSINPNKAYDFYLTDGRKCNDCHWQWVSPDTVTLTGKKGRTGQYSYNEIIGVNIHPVKRWLYRKHIYNLWLPGKAIVPSAFDDRDFLKFPPPPPPFDD